MTLLLCRIQTAVHGWPLPFAADCVDGRCCCQCRAEEW